MRFNKPQCKLGVSVTGSGCLTIKQISSGLKIITITKPENTASFGGHKDSTRTTSQNLLRSHWINKMLYVDQSIPAHLARPRPIENELNTSGCRFPCRNHVTLNLSNRSSKMKSVWFGYARKAGHERYFLPVSPTEDL